MNFQTFQLADMQSYAKRASSPPYLPDCHTDYFRCGTKSLWCTLQQPSALMRVYFAFTFFLTDIRPTKAENPKLKFHHDRLEAWTTNWRKRNRSGKGKTYPEHVASTEQDLPFRFPALTLAVQNLQRPRSQHGPCSATAEMCQGFSALLLPLTLRAPFSPAFTHPSHWAFQQLHGGPGSPREDNPKAFPACKPASHGLWEKTLETNKIMNSLLQLTWKLTS